MIAFADQGLLNKAIETLHVLFVNDLCEDSESVGLNHVVVTLLDIFAQTRDDNEDFILVDFELFDKDVDQPA